MVPASAQIERPLAGGLPVLVEELQNIETPKRVQNKGEHVPVACCSPVSRTDGSAGSET